MVILIKEVSRADKLKVERSWSWILCCALAYIYNICSWNHFHQALQPHLCRQNEVVMYSLKILPKCHSLIGPSFRVTQSLILFINSRVFSLSILTIFRGKPRRKSFEEINIFIKPIHKCYKTNELFENPFLNSYTFGLMKIVQCLTNSAASGNVIFKKNVFSNVTSTLGWQYGTVRMYVTVRINFC